MFINPLPHALYKTNQIFAITEQKYYGSDREDSIEEILRICDEANWMEKFDQLGQNKADPS